MVSHKTPAVEPADLAWTFVPPSIVSGAALTAGALYGDAAVVTEFTTAVATGALSWTAFSGKWAAPLAWGSGAAALALTQAGVTTLAGIDPISLYAWLFSAAAACAARVVYRHRTRHDAIDRQLTRIKLETGQTRQQMALLKLQAELARAGVVEQVVNLQGHTPEETALRTAVYELFKAELLGCTVERTTSGWTAVLDLPATLHRDKLRGEWARVVGALAVTGGFDLADGALSNQLVARYLDRDTLADAVPYRRTDAASFKDRVVLAVDRFGAEVSIDLAYYHLLIAGASRFGKSNLMKLLALRLAALPDAILYGVDMKPGAPEFSLLRPILHDLAETVDQARALFAWLTQEMHERGEIMAATKSSTWDPATHGRPAVFVLVDELGEMVRQGDDVPRGERKISDDLESLLALARAYGIHLVLATQQPSNRVFGGRTDARGNTAIRLSVRTAEPGHGRFVFPERDWQPHKLDAPGKILLFSPEHMEAEPYKAQFVADDVVVAEIERLSREVVPAPVGKRPVLPAPAKLNNQDRVHNRLKQYGNMTRRELEAATGLDEKQVLRACNALPDVERDETTGTWRLVVLPGAPWEAQAVVS